jgi:hypothetical protein
MWRYLRIYSLIFTQVAFLAEFRMKSIHMIRKITEEFTKLCFCMDLLCAMLLCVFWRFEKGMPYDEIDIGRSSSQPSILRVSTLGFSAVAMTPHWSRSARFLRPSGLHSSRVADLRHKLNACAVAKIPLVQTDRGPAPPGHGPA